VEALVQIYPCFFSHSIKLNVAYCYQPSLPRCITCQDIYVQQSNSGIPFIDFKQTQIAHQNKHIRTIKTQKACVTNKNYECAYLNRNDNRILI